MDMAFDFLHAGLAHFAYSYSYLYEFVKYFGRGGHWCFGADAQTRDLNRAIAMVELHFTCECCDASMHNTITVR